jgi:hypothetical protein
VNKYKKKTHKNTLAHTAAAMVSLSAGAHTKVNKFIRPFMVLNCTVRIYIFSHIYVSGINEVGASFVAGDKIELFVDNSFAF